MTDPVACYPPTELERAVAAFQRHAFTALLAGQTPRVTDVAEAASRDTVDVDVDVARAVAWLEAHGQLERDGELLIGAHGITRHATPHALTIDGRTLHTWCAYDAVAIPAALGATGRAATTCPTCGRALVIDVDAGRLPTDPTPVLWLPTGPCEHVMDQFCAHANLFCSAEHLETWRRGAGNAAGRIVTLAEIPALARASWGDVVSQP